VRQQQVCSADRWPHDLTDEQILERLVALNAERAAEEARGVIRWLRPEFQHPAGQPVQKRMEIEPEEEETPKRKGGKTAKPPATSATGAKRAEAGKKSVWPKSLAAQVAAVSQQLQSATKPVTPADIAQGFTRAKADDVAELLDALVTLGKARTTKGGKYVAA
jgi:hypothetical protein